jgi:hypothetical protein
MADAAHGAGNSFTGSCKLWRPNAGLKQRIFRGAINAAPKTEYNEK